MEFIVIWIAFGVLSAVVATGKGRDGCGWFLMGILLGPIGLISAFVASPNEKRVIESGKRQRCPFCAELVRVEAIKCRFCGESLQPADATPTEDDE